jgi:hypothetical protein
MGVYPGLASAPFHDVARLPGALALERNYAAIKAEIEGLAAGEFQAEAEGLMERGSWDVFLFYERSRKNEENCARCPTITRVIEASNTVRTQAGLLYVSKLSPGTHIHPHLGPTNLRLRLRQLLRLAGIEAGGVAPVHERLLVAARRLQRGSQPKLGRRIVRHQRQRRLVAGDRLRTAAERGQRLPAVIQRVAVVRDQRQRRVLGRQGLIVLSDAVQGDPEMVVRLGRLRVQRDRLAQQRDAVGYPVLLQPQQP